MNQGSLKSVSTFQKLLFKSYSAKLFAVQWWDWFTASSVFLHTRKFVILMHGCSSKAFPFSTSMHIKDTNPPSTTPNWSSLRRKGLSAGQPSSRRTLRPQGRPSWLSSLQQWEKVNTGLWFALTFFQVIDPASAAFHHALSLSLGQTSTGCSFPFFCHWLWKILGYESLSQLRFTTEQNMGQNVIYEILSA